MAHAAFCGIASKGEAFASGEIAKPVCPVCAGEMSFRRWLNQGDQRYMNLGECPQCGKVLIRLKFKKAEDGSYCATRLIYAADDGMQNYYEAKLAQPRKRGSGRGRRKKSSK